MYVKALHAMPFYSLLGVSMVMETTLLRSLEQNTFLLPFGSFYIKHRMMISEYKNATFYSLLGVSTMHLINESRIAEAVLSTPFWEFPMRIS